MIRVLSDGNLNCRPLTRTQFWGACRSKGQSLRSLNSIGLFGALDFQDALLVGFGAWNGCILWHGL